jgi:hypothetical protein
MVMQITELYTRQKRLADAHATADAMYEKQSRLDARKADNESESEALCTLSKWGYTDYWKPLRDLAVNYIHERLNNGDSIRKNGMPLASACFIPDGERCDCDWRLETNSQCIHEYKKSGGIFVRSLYPERLFQPHQMNKISPLMVTDGHDDVVMSSMDDNDEAVGGTILVAAQEPKPGDESSANSNEIAGISVLGKRKCCSGDDSFVSNMNSAMKRQKVNRSEMLQVCQNLTDYAVQARPEIGTVLFSSVVQLLDIAQGRHTSLNPSEVVHSAAQAVSSRLLPAARDNPLPGPESRKEGRPRTKRISSAIMASHGGTAAPKPGGRKQVQCSFCSDKICQSIQTCSKLKAIGRRLLKDDVSRFVSHGLSLSKALSNESKINELVTSDRPILASLPTRSTRFLVIHGLYNLQNPAATEEDVGVEVSCYGDMGAIVSGLAPGAHDYGNRIAAYTAVRDWISGNGAKVSGKGTRVIISHSFKNWT